MHGDDNEPHRRSDTSDDAGDTEAEYEPTRRRHRRTSKPTEHAISDRYGGKTTHAEALRGEKRRRTYEEDEATEDWRRDSDSLTNEDSDNSKPQRCSRDSYRKDGHAKNEKNTLAKIQKQVAWMQTILGITEGQESRAPEHATRLHEVHNLGYEGDATGPQCHYPTSGRGNDDEDMMTTEGNQSRELTYGDEGAEPRAAQPGSRSQLEDYEVHARSRYSPPHLRLSDEARDTMATEDAKPPRNTEAPQLYTETSQLQRVGITDTITIQKAKLELLLEKFNSATIAAKQAGIMCSIAKQSLAVEVASFENCRIALSALLTNLAHPHDDWTTQ